MPPKVATAPAPVAEQQPPASATEAPRNASTAAVAPPPQTAPMPLPRPRATAMVAAPSSAERWASAAPSATPKLSPSEFVAQADQPVLPTSLRRSDDPDPRIARLQILLDRSNVSPGVIDGFSGDNLAKAVGALQNMSGLPATGRMGADVDQILAAVSSSPVFVNYAIQPDDVAGPFVSEFPARLCRARHAAFARLSQCGRGLGRKIPHG